MAKQNFANMLTKNSKSNAGDELRKIEASKDGYEKLILYHELRPSEFNEYTITQDKINEIAESLKHRGLLQNLVVIPVEDKDYKYKILVGETRYHAIGKLFKEGSTKFESGIRCLVIDKDTTLVDQKIIMEETNIKQREYDSKTRREAISRLTTLYKQKNEETGNQESATKKVAEMAKIGERQVQRYNAVNEKLIPELIEALDNSKISLERAAQFSNMTEDAQHLVVELLKTNSNVKKAEIELIEKAALEKEEQLVKQLTEKETLLTNIEKQNQKLNNEKSIREKVLEETSEKEILLRKEIEEELKSNDPNKKLLEKLQLSMDIIKKEKEDALKLTDSLEKKLNEKNSELTITKKELKEIKNSDKNSIKNILTEEEKKELTDSFELINILNDIKKNLNQFLVKNEKYMSNYKELPGDVKKIFHDLENKIEEGKVKMNNI